MLAIDYGTKRVGLAVSDSSGTIATPLAVISIKKDPSAKNIVDHIEPYVQEWRVKSLLIGNPSGLATHEVSFLNEIKELSKALEARFHTKVVEYDESSSTKRANQRLQESGQTQKSARGKIDAVSASVFLQEFLDNIGE